MQRLWVTVLSGLVLLVVTGCQRGTDSLSTASGTAVPQPVLPDMILLTTTSVRDSGLLDVLVADFQRRTGYRVKPIVAGSGQVLTLGANGAGDVLLTHSPAAEMAWFAAGHGLERRLVMFNDYLIVGPPDDPAGVRVSPFDQRRVAARGVAAGALHLAGRPVRYTYAGAPALAASRYRAER